MGNCLGCSDSGKRLLTAATDGDVAEARKLLEVKPGLSKYTTFGRLSSPLHVAAAGGHSEIVMMLLEYGADVNSRNFYGHTPLMEACNNGCWEVVQVLLLFKCNVSKVEYLSGWTALHFAAQSGHIPCIRLLATDFAPGVPHGATDSPKGETERDLPNSSLSDSNDRQALSRFINTTAKCGITALHLAAVNGNADCVHLLLDLHADVSATGLYHSSSVASIGAGSTPLHYAAYSGNLKCCQVLLARGASRSAVNCHGWLPVDVARIWGCHELVPILSPKSNPTLPVFPPNCLALPLISILKIAREYGLNSSTVPSDESDLCAVCLESACTVAAEGCGHGLCTRCAFCLCSTSNIKSEVSAPPGSIPCPLCREGIVAFARLQTLPAKDQIKLDGETQTRLDDKCNSDLHSQNPSAAARRSQLYKNQSAVVPSEAIGMIICPTHLPNRCQSAEHEGIRPVVDRTAPEDMEKIIEQRTSCSTSFQNGRLCSIR